MSSLFDMRQTRCQIPLLINTEIPFHKTYDKPCFVVLSSNFGTRGTRYIALLASLRRQSPADTTAVRSQVWLCLERDHVVCQKHRKLAHPGDNPGVAHEVTRCN